MRFTNVHYFAAGASLFGNDAQGAYQYAGKDYVGRHMHPAPFDNCTGCHNTHELTIQMDKCVTCHAGIKDPKEIRMTAADLRRRQEHQGRRRGRDHDAPGEAVRSHPGLRQERR